MADLRAPRQPLSRRLRWVLGLSLALNLIFVGFAAGTAWRLKDGPPGGAPGARTLAAGFVHALQDADHRQMRRALRRDARALHSRANRRQDRAEVLALLRADDLDEAALNAFFDRQSARTTALQGTAQQRLLSRIKAMAPAERLAYADRLESLLNRPRGPRQKDR